MNRTNGVSRVPAGSGAAPSAQVPVLLSSAFVTSVPSRDDAAQPAGSRGSRGSTGPTSAHTARARRRSTALCLLSLVFLCGLAYADVDREVFHYDSFAWLEQLADGQFERPWARLLGRPLVPNQTFSEALLAWNLGWNRALGLDELDVTGFLVFNVLLHAAVVCLLFLLLDLLLERTGGRSPRWIPLAAAAVFAVHPVHVHTVAYVIQRRGALAACFTLLGAIAYLKARTPGAMAGSSAAFVGPTTAQRAAWGALVALCLWLAAHSKVVGLTMAISLLVLELCLAARDPQSLRRSLRWLSAAGVALALGFAYFALVRGLFDLDRLVFTPIGGEELWGVWPQFLTQLRATTWYQLLLAFPLPAWSAIEHHLPLSRTLGDHSAFLALALHAGWLAAGVAALWRKHSLAALGIFWFYIPLSPYLVLPEADHLVEYKTYLPSVGILILTVAGLRALNERIQGWSALVWVWAALALWIALLFAATLRTHQTYQTTVAIWADAVEAHPGNPRAVYHLGLALAGEGRGEEAMPHFRVAARLAPKWSGPAASIGHLLAERDQRDLALRWYRRAVAAEQDDLSARLGLARVLIDIGRPAAALPHLEVVLEDPRRYAADAYLLRGRALWSLGRRQAAVDELSRAHQLGSAHKDAGFHFVLGEVSLRADLYGPGILALRRALERRPGWAEAANNLAWHLATAPAPYREPGEAIELAEFAAAQTARQDLNVLDTLATVLAAGGRPKEALRVIGEALEKVPPKSDPSVAEGLRATQRAVRASLPPPAGPRGDRDSAEPAAAPVR